MSRAEDRDLAYEAYLRKLQREQNAECWGPDEQREWEEKCERNAEGMHDYDEPTAEDLAAYDEQQDAQVSNYRS